MGTPDDANWLERLRDRTLAFFVRWNRIFEALAMVAGVALVGFGVLIALAFLPAVVGTPNLFGWADTYPKCQDAYLGTIGNITEQGTSNRPPRGYWHGASHVDWAASHCTDAQFLMTMCIKSFVCARGSISQPSRCLAAMPHRAARSPSPSTLADTDVHLLLHQLAAHPMAPLHPQ